MFSRKICKIFKNNFFTEDPQRLLLTFNSNFQRSTEQKTGTTVSDEYQIQLKKVFSVTKISTPVREIIPEFFYPFILVY